MNKEFLNKIIKGDCIKKLKMLPANSVDLIFADPPYNLQLKNELFRPNQTKVAGVNDKWDQFDSFKHYDKFTNAWMKECKRVLKENGSIWVIGSYHNIFRVGNVLQNLKFWILNDVIWVKSNPMPNFMGTRFTNSQETLIWAGKSQKSKYTFHYKSLKTFNDDKQMRSVWNIPICSGLERIKVNDKKAHSTQKPEALLFRIILSTSNVGDIVLDPFMGSGTTGAVAKKLKRNFIGIEKEDFYIKVANERIKKVKPLDEDLLTYPVEKKMHKVPFGNLIEKGMIKIGDSLYSKNKKYTAKILANATLRTKKEVGSIHLVSAKVLEKTSNNGWTFWYVENKKGELTLIDEIRTKYIKKYLI